MVTKKSTKIHPVFAVVLLTLLGLMAGYAILRVAGGGLGIRDAIDHKVWRVTGIAKMLWNGPAIQRESQGNFTNIIFLHHSTGNNLIQQGGVRELFTQKGYSFWDHGYNEQGLRGPDKKVSGFNYQVPQDNTDPDGLAKIFSQKVYPLPVNTLTALLQHEVIIIKSCFDPGNHIGSDSQLELYQNYYLDIRKVMDKYPDHIFIIVTIPPLNPAETNPDEAARARKFADWLKSEEFLEGHANIFTFDFFDNLAEGDPKDQAHNMLRAQYQDGTDSHPNKLANETIAPIFVNFVVEKIELYRSEVAK
jgi:hypothetical protein